MVFMNWSNKEDSKSVQHMFADVLKNNKTFLTTSFILKISKFIYFSFFNFFSISFSRNSIVHC